MDVIEAIHTRRSIRSYSPRLVERELIEDIIWDAAQAPPRSAGNNPGPSMSPRALSAFRHSATKHCSTPGTTIPTSQDGSGQTDLTLRSSGAPLL